MTELKQWWKEVKESVHQLVLYMLVFLLIAGTSMITGVLGILVGGSFLGGVLFGVVLWISCLFSCRYDV